MNKFWIFLTIIKNEKIRQLDQSKPPVKGWVEDIRQQCYSQVKVSVTLP